MNKRINNLTIGQSLFIASTLLVAFFLFLSTAISNQLFFSRTDTLIAETSKEINKQVIMNYENYLSHVIEISNSLQEYIVDYTQEDDLNSLSNILDATLKIQPNLLNIALVNTTGSVIASTSTEPINPDLEFTTWFRYALMFKDIHHFSTPHVENLVREGLDEVFTISKQVQYIEKGEIKTAVLMIDVSTEDLKTLALRTNLGDKGHILITDINNDLVYDSNGECEVEGCASIETVKTLILGGQLMKVDGINMYVNVSTLQDTRWKITTFINVDTIVKTKTDVLISVILVFMATLLAIGIISAWLARRITGPMSILKKHIQRLEEGDFEAQVHVEGQKEVVLLAEAFNIMSNRIHELMMRILDEQNEKRKTHFIALQNQINPHFLYNTLDSIVALSENNRNKDVESAIVALSKFFRMSITNDMNLVALKEEVDHVRHYLLIQQIRYRQNFEFIIDIDERLYNLPVIKLSLQPLVENAILHGIQPDQDFTQIRISAHALNDFLYVEVYNQGFGLTQQRILEIQHMIQSSEPSSSLGLKNVYQRLKLYYGDAADLLFESELDIYTKVILKMPIKKEE